MNVRLLFAGIAIVAGIGVSAVAQQPGAQQPGAAGAAAIPDAPKPPDPNALHVYIRAGLKSHGPGLHDYPQYLADWSKLLTERGAVVDGSLHFPTPAELEGVHVMVMYKGDAGYMTDQERATLDAFVKRGGGLVSFHDSLCGPDTAHMASFVGGSKKHGERNFSQGEMKYTIVDPEHPIMAGMSDFTITDEAFMRDDVGAVRRSTCWRRCRCPAARSRAKSCRRSGPTSTPCRAGSRRVRFVWMQGHTYTNFADPRVQPMILRGIAWAARQADRHVEGSGQDADRLATSSGRAVQVSANQRSKPFRRTGSPSATRTASFIAAGSGGGCRKASSTAGRSSASATRGRSSRRATATSASWPITSSAACGKRAACRSNSR